MAIKVSGTTVVDDSRNLQNLVNLNTSGNVYANTFVGDADQLTNLPASGGSFEAIASGTLSDGSAVIVNADGTVSVVEETTFSQVAGTPVSIDDQFNINFGAAYDSVNQKVVVSYRNISISSYGHAVVGTVNNSDNSISFGSPVVFNSGTTLDTTMSYDTNSGKMVISYSDFGNSQYGTAIVGTVSGTSISFGSEAVFKSGTARGINSAYDSTAQKVVNVYTDGSTNLYAIVGTVSGTSISFGSEATIHNNVYDVPGVAYDSANDKTVAFYVDNADSQKGKAKVGTVSGTSITFGTAAEFESASTLRISAAYDSSAGAIVAAYSASSTGKSAVGTVSGTDISFGTPVQFESGLIKYTTSSYDASTGKIVIAYEDDANSDYGTVVAGTVNGTSITFETPMVFYNGSVDEIGSVYDANAERVVVFYEDESDSSKGKGVVFQAASTTTSLTSENFIGISNGAYANNVTATVQIKGAVDDAQSGLTPGQQYFVQANGSINTTAADPSVFAGTAIASNKLIVKG